MCYQQMHATVIGQSCLKLATNPVIHKRSKHIDTKVQFKREKVDNHSIHLVYTRSDQLAADLLTKALPQVRVEEHRLHQLGQMQIFFRLTEKSEWGVEEKNLHKFFGLQNLNCSLLIAQNREKTN